MGGRGGSSGLSSTKSQLAGAKADLAYAKMKMKEYGTTKFGGTKATRDKYEMWSNEARRAQKEITRLEKMSSKK